MRKDNKKQGKLSPADLAAANLAAANYASGDIAPVAAAEESATALCDAPPGEALESTMADGPTPEPSAKESPRGPGEKKDAAGAPAPPAEEVPPVGWQAPLIDLMAAVVRKAWLVLLLFGAGLAAGIYKLKTTPSYYRASCVAVLLPREKPNLDVSVSTSSLETGMDPAKREASGPLMLPPNTDLYTTILMSRPVLLAIARKYGDELQQAQRFPENDRSDEVVDRIRQMLKISGTDEGMITIEVTANNNELAAKMANEFLVEMEGASKAIERQLILQQSGFLETAQEQVAAALATDEQKLTDFYARHGVIDMAAQAADILRMKREQKQEMYILEQQMMTRLTNYTEQDDTVITMKQRIAKHLERIEELSKSYLDVISQEDYGQVQIEYDGLREQVRYKRDLLATISTQQSVFRIRAEQPAGSVAVLNTAVPAARPAGPSKKLTLGLPAIGGLLFAIALILVLEQWTGSVADPYISRRIGEIKRGLIPAWVRKLFRLLLAPFKLFGLLGMLRRRK